MSKLMKSMLILIFLIFIILSNVAGQIDFKHFEKSLIKLNDTTYVSKFETTIEDYQIFLADYKKFKPNKYYEVIYDSINMQKISENFTVMMSNYYWHPAFKYYPITNIRHDAAIEFCYWLTEQYNKFLKRKYKSVVFRLPTAEEWVHAARHNDKDAMFGWNSKYNKKKGKCLANFKYRDSNDANAINHTTQVGKFKPNKSGLFDMSGNISEMTVNNNIVKGGCYNDSIEKITIDYNHDYDGEPNNFVGFRIFMYILKTNNQ